MLNNIIFRNKIFISFNLESFTIYRLPAYRIGQRIADEIALLYNFYIKPAKKFYFFDNIISNRNI